MRQCRPLQHLAGSLAMQRRHFRPICQGAERSGFHPGSYPLLARRSASQAGRHGSPGRRRWPAQPRPPDGNWVMARRPAVPAAAKASCRAARPGVCQGAAVMLPSSSRAESCRIAAPAGVPTCFCHGKRLLMAKTTFCRRRFDCPRSFQNIARHERKGPSTPAAVAGFRQHSGCLYRAAMLSAATPSFRCSSPCSSATTT